MAAAAKSLVPSTAPSAEGLPSAPSSYDLLADPAVYDLLTDEHRNELAAEAVKELDAIGLTQQDTRDSNGRLKDAHVLAQVLALRVYGHSPTETAEILGISPYRVVSLLHRVRRDAEVEQQLTRLDAIAVPLATDNIIRGLILGDKDYTLEFAKGRGLFKTHQSVKQETEIREISIKIEAKLPAHLEGMPPPQIKAGAMVGAAGDAPKPRAIEGEVLDAG